MLPKKAATFLHSKKTALVLLVLIVAALAFSTLLPDPQFTEYFSVWQANNPVLYRLFSLLGLTAVYNSWWFITLCLCLLLSTAFCLPQMWRCLFSPSLRNIAKPRQELALPVSPFFARERVACWLSERRLPCRLTVDSESSLLFHHHKSFLPSQFGVLLLHFALLVIALAGVLTGLLAYRGNVTLIEGQSFRDVYGGYAAFWPGVFPLPFGEAEFTLLAVLPPQQENLGFPAQVQLEVFDAKRNYAAVEVLEQNSSFSYRGLRLYPRRFGYAPLLNVSDNNGERLFTGFVGLERKETGKGTIHKDSFLLPGIGLAVTARYHPPAGGQAPHLEVEFPQTNNKQTTIVIGMGEERRFGEYLIEFAGLRHYQLFHVVRDIGVYFFAMGSFLLCFGAFLYYFFPGRQVTISLEQKGEVLFLSSIFAGPGQQLLKEEFAKLISEIKQGGLIYDG